MSGIKWFVRINVVLLCSVVHSQNVYSNFRPVTESLNLRNPFESFSASERKSNSERGLFQDHVNENRFTNLNRGPFENSNLDREPFENSNLDNKNWIKVNYRVAADKKLETQITDNNEKVVRIN